MAKVIYVVDWTIKNIRIEAYPMYGHLGWNPYARFTVYPASGLVVKAQRGVIRSEGSITKLVSESVGISKRLTKTGFKIDSLGSATGVFFDSTGRLITPNFSVTDGMLDCGTEDCNGTAIIEYNATVALYEYDADIVPVGDGVEIRRGLIYAYDSAEPKNIATYEIPANDLMIDSDREDMIIIYREVVVQGAKTFEMPDVDWDNDNSYSQYPAALESDKPVASDAWAADEIDRFIVFAENGAIWDDKPALWWYKPSAPAAFNGVVWKIRDNIPAAPTATISATMITELQAKRAALVTEYGIIE